MSENIYTLSLRRAWGKAMSVFGVSRGDVIGKVFVVGLTLIILGFFGRHFATIGFETSAIDFGGEAMVVLFALAAWAALIFLVSLILAPQEIYRETKRRADMSFNLCEDIGVREKSNALMCALLETAEETVAGFEDNGNYEQHALRAKEVNRHLDLISSKFLTTAQSYALKGKSGMYTGGGLYRIPHLEESDGEDWAELPRLATRIEPLRQLVLSESLATIARVRVFGDALPHFIEGDRELPIDLRKAKELGHLEDFIAEHEADPEGDLDKLDALIKHPSQGSEKATRPASPRASSDD